MKVFIIGASGLVGSHCLNVFKSNKVEVIGTHFTYVVNDTIYFNPLDDKCIDYMQEFKPDVIIHCGALTNVDYCEENINESYRLTVESTKKIVDYCSFNDCKLVYFSTDYVFDGFDGPYKEIALVQPINVYGMHKLRAETLVTQLKNYIIARITNVYGEEERNKNFISRLIIVLNSNEKKEIKLPIDQFATPVYAGDVAKMIYLLVQNNKNGIYNLSSNDYYNRFSLANKIKSYYPEKNNLKLIPVITSELNQKARRPLEGGLLNIKFSSEFPEFIFTTIDSYLSKNLRS